jgi:DNA-binding NarL/FixJ family response regulator
MRVVIADDEALLRDGLAVLLDQAGFTVAGKAADPAELRRLVATERPDAAVVDIKMPPSFTDEGIVAAQEILDLYPGTGVLVLSHYLESGYAMRLLEGHPGGAGYLLKERVSSIAVLADALHRLAEGECVIDPTIVSRLIARRERDRLTGLSQREREVLTLMAEGRSNLSISQKLSLSPKTVEAHVGSILLKLGLDGSPDTHRRVLAVLAFLRNAP